LRSLISKRAECTGSSMCGGKKCILQNLLLMFRIEEAMYRLKPVCIALRIDKAAIFRWNWQPKRARQ
jgi:hypothetical protein